MSGFTHESFRNESKEWYTPPFLFERLGVEFDLDPCAPPDGFVWTVPARQKFTADDNGLLLPWDGTVFMNPPYGTDTPRWLNKLAAHGDGIGLVFARTDTRWFHDYAIAADVLCFVRGRLSFLRPDGSPAGSPGAGSLLVAYGEECADALLRSGLGACFKAVEECA